LAVSALLLAAAGLTAGSRAPADAVTGTWLAGDLHVHTTYSHDSWGGPLDPADEFNPEELYTLGWTTEQQFTNASLRGLDYLAITDHNDIRSQTDPGWGADGLTAVHGYENSLRGHAQMLGASRIYDRGDNSADAITAMADTLRTDGGVFQINHPAEGTVDYPNDLDWGYAYEVVPDTVEIWNISWPWQPPAPSGSSNDDAVRYWEGWLDRGHQVGATGGSDNHYIATAALQGVGQPTTWVYATESTERGVLEALSAGRTYISWQPPVLLGPELLLEGDVDRDGTYGAMIGDTVPRGTPLRVLANRAPLTTLRVVTDGGAEAFAPMTVTSTAFEHRFTLPDAATWVRAEVYYPDAAEVRGLCDPLVGGDTTYCRNGLLMVAMTSPMYLAPPVETGLSVSAPAVVRYSDPLAVTATLTGGQPVAGASIRFTLGTSSVVATTDGAGVARATLDITDPPGPYTLTARFDGDARWLPSTATAPVLVRREVRVMTWAGDRQVDDGRTLLGVVVRDDEGTRLPGVPVTFTVDGLTYTVTTNVAGVAQRYARLPDRAYHRVLATADTTDLYRRVAFRITLPRA